MILNVSTDDYSNYSHNIARALRSIGLDCVDVTNRKHRFKYGSDSPVLELRDMIPLIRKADVIQVMHSDHRLLDMAQRYGRGEIIVYHTGTRYRDRPEHYEALFKGYRSVTDQTEFMSLGNHFYLVSPVELPLAPLYKGGKLKIGHYPSEPVVKGTKEIIEMLKPFEGQFEWLHSTKLVSHKEQLKRIAECDVYIELFKPELNGKPYGCFGVTALEAAAMGKLVITNNLHREVYVNAYGNQPFATPNDPASFYSILVNTIQSAFEKHEESIKKVQELIHKAMVKNHSYQATGNRLAKFIFDHE